MTVMSLRLSDRELQMIQSLSRAEAKERSTMVRELLEEGWMFHMLRLYRDGKLSLGRLSKLLRKSLSETIDLLRDFGQPAPIDYEDYLQGRRIATRLLSP